MPWPAAPNTPPVEENRTNAARSRSRVSSCRVVAASTFGRSTRSSWSAVSEVIVASSSTPAVCTTAVSGCSAGTPASSPVTASRSATSQATNSTAAPLATSRSRRSSAPGAARPRLLVRTRLRMPCRVTRCSATRPPRVPVAPVTSTVPFGSSAVGSAAGPTLARRGANATPSRRASSGSPAASAAVSASAEVSASSRSTRTNRPGCSACAERTRPRAAALARSATSSSAPTATALRVTSTRCWSSRVSSASQVRSRSSTPVVAERTESSWLATKEAKTTSASPPGTRRTPACSRPAPTFSSSSPSTA